MILRKVFILASTVLAFSVNVFPQNLEIEKTETANGKINLHYSIIDTVAGKFYTVRVYSSQDNFMHPLTRISGDAGINLRPGLHKKITWDPAELGEAFSGKVKLEVRARQYIPFVHFEGFKGYTKIKRLKPYTVTWSGGASSNVLNLELLRGDEKITVFPNLANVGHHTILLPQDVKPGKGYRFRISDNRNKDEVVVTEEFQVKRKIPLLLKIMPALVVGGIIYGLLPQNEPNNNIPDPVVPGNK
jgi:hypothetical protein